ncbi:hypothetical protein SCP_0509270 [Sparassis crispa]|uniref:Uncharacterized protein n=1 Tax=Sparassis crispa TaxID=139825 RepID=A0A401GNX3_9APHY|nr:hypothetical protein SCP_0509270 [Sparassis crispa]GBE83870.1 hypothetical protein SCP_0509270 [Sparassis crispa]
MLEDPSRVHLRSLRIPTGFNPGEKVSVLLAEVVELAYALASSLGIRYLHLGLSSAGYMTLRWLSQMESQPREIKLSNLEIHNQLSYWQLLQPFIDSLQVLRVEGFDRFDTGNGLVWPRLSRAFPAVQDLVVIDTKLAQAAPLMQYLNIFFDHTDAESLECVVGQLYVLDGLALAGITLYTSSPLHVSDCVYQNWAQEAAALVSSLTKITFGDVSDDEHYVMFCITRAEGSVPEVERKSSSEEFNAQCDLLKPGCSANWSNTVCIQ